jgi:hypothetical protein
MLLPIFKFSRISQLLYPKLPLLHMCWWTPGAAYVKVIDDAFATGKIALVVAGTNAADTRMATSLLSQGKLADQTASGVKISRTVTAPVVTPM